MNLEDVEKRNGERLIELLGTKLYYLVLKHSTVPIQKSDESLAHLNRLNCYQICVFVLRICFFKTVIDICNISTVYTLV